MPYPNYKNKHLEVALFNPDDYVKFGYDKGKFPKKYVIVFQNRSERHIKRNYKVRKIPEGSKAGNVYAYKDIGFYKIAGIGAPLASTVLEELIALGGREFIIVGTAGGLRDTGIKVCDKAIRDEGTSFHYIPHGKYSYPNKTLMSRLCSSIKKMGADYELGTTWTIDAPYRETLVEIQRYMKEGVLTVEMEASAMFAVANVRNVKIAAAFSVSDIVGKAKWEPQFKQKHVKDNLQILIDAAFDCFSK